MAYFPSCNFNTTISWRPTPLSMHQITMGKRKKLLIICMIRISATSHMQLGILWNSIVSGLLTAWSRVMACTTRWRFSWVIFFRRGTNILLMVATWFEIAVRDCEKFKAGLDFGSVVRHAMKSATKPEGNVRATRMGWLISDVSHSLT